MCVDDTNRMSSATVGQLYTEPAFGDECVKTDGGQIRIEPGVGLLESVGAPGNGQARAEDAGDVVLTGWSEEGPAMCCKQG